MHEEIRLRTAVPDDAAALLDIYAPYVRSTAITFEYEVPSVQEFQHRIQKTLERYPYIVAEQNGEVLGYAYAGAFKERAAYDWAVEVTIYVRQNAHKNGVGKLLYQALEDICSAQHITNLNACIGYPEIEDEYLTKNSAQFHEHLGYHMVGMFHQCGYKFGRWYHMVWMEKIIGEHHAEQPPIIKFSQLNWKW